MRLSKFIDRFLELRSTDLRRTTTDRIYRPAFKSFLSVCGDKVLVRYSVLDVEKFKSHRLQTCTPTTVNIEFRSLRSAFNSAVAWGMLRENPFRKSSPIRIPERLPKFLTKGEFQRLLQVVNVPVLRELFLFAAMSGMRQGEMLNLRWQDVDLGRKLILVMNSDAFTTKSGRCRTVPMNETVFELLTRRSLTMNFCVWVFHREGKQLTQSFVGHAFKRCVRKLGLNEGLKFHSLRCSFGSWLVQSGVSIYQVSKLLGHADVKTTQTFYAHLLPNEMHGVVSQIAMSEN